MEAALNGPSGRTTLGSTPLTIGRKPENQLVLNDSKSSSHHAEIRPQGQEYSIVDLGSTNGTYINDQRLDANVPRTLNAGDRVRIGDTNFIYEVTGAQQYDPTVFVGPAQGSSPGYDPTVAMPEPQFGGNPQPPQSYPQVGYIPPAPQQPVYPSPPQPGYQQYTPPTPPAQPQQPVYPPPGYPQQPPPGQPVKKSNRTLWIILGSIGGVLVLLILACVVLFAVVAANASTPEKTMTTFCSDLKSSNFHDAYKQMSTSFQSRTSEQNFTTGLTAIFQSGGGLRDCTFGSVNTGSTTASTTMIWTAMTNGLQPLSKNVILINEGGVWKISNLQ